MRSELIRRMKLRIESALKDFLQDEGIELSVASNDNIPCKYPVVELEGIDDIVLSGSKLLFEIRVALRLLGKSRQCESLVRGIYYILHPHNLTVPELTVLLMSIHVEELLCEHKKMQKMKAVMRYVIEGDALELPDLLRIRDYLVEEC